MIEILDAIIAWGSHHPIITSSCIAAMMASRSWYTSLWPVRLQSKVSVANAVAVGATTALNSGLMFSISNDGEKTYQVSQIGTSNKNGAKTKYAYFFQKAFTLGTFPVNIEAGTTVDFYAPFERLSKTLDWSQVDRFIFSDGRTNHKFPRKQSNAVLLAVVEQLTKPTNNIELLEKQPESFREGQGDSPSH